MRRLPGKYSPNVKNRSSKHLSWLTKMRPLVRTLSREALIKMGTEEANKEIKRRDKKNSNKA